MKTSALFISLLAGVGFVLFAQTKDPVPPAFEQAAGKAASGEAAVDPFDPDIGAPKQVQVQVEYVEVAHETLTRLLFLAKPASADATRLRQQVQDLVAKNEAKVLETQLVVAKPNQKATAEAIHEFIYPTEYEPYDFLPRTTGATPEQVGHPPQKPEVRVLPATPSAWDMRALGSILEVEPNISEEDQIIDLRFVPELTWHTGDTNWTEYKDPLGDVIKVAEPDFYTLRLNASIHSKNGHYALAGVLSPKDAKGETDFTRKVLVFVKCDILIVK
jgi:hypothetical protein